MEEKKNLQLSWIIVAVVVSLGLIFSTIVWITGFNKSKPTYGTINVTGSAKQQIKSDFATWRGTYSTQAKVLSDSYNSIKGNQATVKKYLKDKGIPDNEVTFWSVNTDIIYVKNYSGWNTNEIEGYKLSQTVEIKSNNVDKIEQIARESTELIDKGVVFESSRPQYFYTKIADLKIDMLAKATKDATERAKQIASNSDSSIIGVKSSRMGVFQITPLYSNDVSDYGINDTSSIEKEIMSVMNCEFKIK